MGAQTISLKALILGGALTLSAQAPAELFTMTGSANAAAIKINQNTLRFSGGTVQATGGAKNDITADESGRIFAISNSDLFEFDPETLAVLNQQPFEGLTRGLAASGGRLFALTGSSNPRLVRFSADTLQLEAGTVQSTGGARNNVAFDETGRLFAISNSSLLEFEPDTLEILNEQAFAGLVKGLAARGGSLFSLTGTSGLNLLRFDADTLTLRAGTPESQGGARNDLAFDENGRLFGVANQLFAEFDPITLEVLHTRSYIGNINGIAADEFNFAKELSAIATPEKTQSGMRLTIPRAPGRRIGVEYSQDLSPGSWFDLGNFFEAADGLMEFADPDPIRRDRPSGYYRAFLRPLLPNG